MALKEFPNSDWGMGEVSPVSGEEMLEAVQQRWDDQVELMNERLPDDHEPAAVLDGKIVLARNLTLKAIKGTKTYALDVVEHPGEHKAVIGVSATILSVGGLLGIIHTLRPRKK